MLKQAAAALAACLVTGLILGVVGCSSRVTGPYQGGPSRPYNPIGSLDIDPTWSPDAQRLAYFHGKRDAADSVGIYIVDTTGATPTRLSPVSAYFSMELAWSPDGSRIAFYNGDVFTVDVADGSLRQWSGDAPYCHWPTWSPDGRYILYTVTARSAFAPESTAGFHVIDTRDGSQRAFVHDSVLVKAGAGGMAHWAPDGSSIAFFTWLHPNAGGAPPFHSDLVVLSVDGVTWRRVITVSGIAENPQWSADGRTLFFDLTPSPLLPADTDATTTWVVNADGTGLRQWPVNLVDPRVQFAFPFQLDRTGRRVAYVGLDSSGKRGVIWAMNVDGTSRRQLTLP